jgi:hypothetical protein
VPISIEQHASEATEHGIPADVVERALGRPPRDFAAFARGAAHVWR